MTVKQEVFLQEYLVDFNATRAYQDSYKNSTYRTAGVESSRLLRNPRFKLHLDKALKERAESTRVDSSYVVEYLKGAAELDLEDFATIGQAGVELKEFKKIPKRIRKYCTEITASESKHGTIIVNFKVFSKEKAIEMLAKHTGTTKERIEHSGTIGVSLTDLINKHS